MRGRLRHYFRNPSRRRNLVFGAALSALSLFVLLMLVSSPEMAGERTQRVPQLQD